MELTWCQVEKVALKAAFILLCSWERHKVVIGSRSKLKFLTPSPKKCSIFSPHQINSPHQCQLLARKRCSDSSRSTKLV